MVTTTSSKDIFISYKNDGEGSNFAARLCADLEKIGYSVYYNPNEQRAGNFPDRLKDAVESCRDFLIIITQACKEQLMRHDKIDWVREELITAYNSQKNIIPLLMPGVSMPRDKAEMPADICFLPDKDAINISEPYDRSPLDFLLSWVVSKPEKNDIYKDTYKSNPYFDIDIDFLNLLKKAQLGDEQAMYEVAVYYKNGFVGAIDDYQNATYWFEKVLQGNNDVLKAHSYNQIAGFYFSGEMPGEEQSYEKAFEYREKASKIDSNALMQVAAMRRIGSGTPFDFNKIEEDFLKFENGDSISMSERAQFYYDYGMFDKTVDIYKKIQNQMPEAAYRLGLLYKRGVHLSPPEPDCFRAADCFQRAANKGHVGAMYELGMLYFNPPYGEFEKDFNQAVKYFKISADNGNAEAQYKLGHCYLHGLGNEIDVEKSIKYFEKAALQGHVGAQGALSKVYQKPGFINYQKAFYYAKSAADAGYNSAAFYVGNFLLIGRGCQANIDEALKYYRIACKHGHYDAELMINKIKEIKSKTFT